MSNENQFDDLRNFALVAFLNDHGWVSLMLGGDPLIRAMGAEAGLDEPRLERVLARIHQIQSMARDEKKAWMRKNSN